MERQSNLETKWLRTLGLRYNPFTELDAGADPRLHEYLVEDGGKIFSNIYKLGHSFVFGETGSGKSALRVRLAEACRADQDQQGVFPIVYKPTAYLSGDQQQKTILQTTALELFFQLAYRPYRFIDLDKADQKKVRSFLEQYSPIAIDHLFDQLLSGMTIPEAALGYDPTFFMVNHPDRKLLQRFQQAMTKTSSSETVFDGIENVARHLLLDPLNYEAAYLLIDEVNGLWETSTNPRAALRLILPLLAQATSWQGSNLYLKAFLPLELKDLIKRDFPELSHHFSNIVWTEEALTKMLKCRLEMAKDIAPLNLASIFDPNMRTDIEKEIITAIYDSTGEYNPAEVLRLTKRIIEEHLNRAGPIGKLTRQDFDKAVRWYQNQQ